VTDENKYADFNWWRCQKCKQLVHADDPHRVHYPVGAAIAFWLVVTLFCVLFLLAAHGQ
jgi:hypothetical protein